MRRAFVGQNEPQRTVTVSFELPGQLASISADEGDSVSQGQIIARQDTSLLEAERTTASCIEGSRRGAAQISPFKQSGDSKNSADAVLLLKQTSTARLPNATRYRDEFPRSMQASRMLRFASQNPASRRHSTGALHRGLLTVAKRLPPASAFLS